MHSISNKIYKIMKSKSIEECYIYSDFLYIANYDAVRKAFSILEKEKKIKKILPGIYYAPFYSESINEYSLPEVESVVNAISRKFGWTITQNDNSLLNSMGLSTQVPAKYEFYTDGPSKVLKISGVNVKLTHRNNFYLKKFSPKMKQIIRSINAIGYKHMDDNQIKKLRNMLNDNEKQKLIKESRTLPFNMQGDILEISKTNA